MYYQTVRSKMILRQDVHKWKVGFDIHRSISGIKSVGTQKTEILL